MKQVIELKNRIEANFKPKDIDKVSENFVLYNLADPEALSVLEQNGITLKKNSQVIVLAQDAKTLTQTLDLATKMGFKEAYEENPLRLRTLVSDVIKRIAKCDAIGVPYKTDKGFANFLFSSRLFKQMTDSLTEEQKKIITTPSLENDDKVNSVERELLSSIIKRFNFTDESVANIYQKLAEVETNNQGANPKEKLMTTLKETCSVDEAFLEKVIDETIVDMENDSIQRRAA